MAAVKRHQQFCALARSLDSLGDRWTLLIVRELMIAPAGFSALATRLPGIASNLLASRLLRLQEDGVVDRPDTGRTYALTARGQQLRPVLTELIRWGAPLMTGGPGDDLVEDEWAALALEAVLTAPDVSGPDTKVLIRCGETTLHVSIDKGERRVAPADGGATEAEVAASLPELLGAAHSGVLAQGLVVRGNRAAAARAFRRTTLATSVASQVTALSP